MKIQYHGKLPADTLAKHHFDSSVVICHCYLVFYLHNLPSSLICDYNYIIMLHSSHLNCFCWESAAAKHSSDRNSGLIIRQRRKVFIPWQTVPKACAKWWNINMTLTLFPALCSDEHPYSPTIYTPRKTKREMWQSMQCSFFCRTTQATQILAHGKTSLIYCLDCNF